MKYILIVLFWFVNLHFFNAFADRNGKTMDYPAEEKKHLGTIELLHGYGKILAAMINDLEHYPEGEEKERLKEEIKELEEILRRYE